MTEEEINEEQNNQSQVEGNVGFAVPAEDVDSGSISAGLSEAAGSVLQGVIEGIGSIISGITD